MREVWRVLRDDGVVFLTIADSYIRDPKPGWKLKDLAGVPWSVAFALRADGWFLRSDIVWFKLNPMPESVQDRPGRSHEYVFLLAKSNRYFWDAVAVQELANYDGRTKTRHDGAAKYEAPIIPGENKVNSSARDGHERWPNTNENGDRTRNLRTVWSIPTQPYKGSHYATFPERLVETCIKAGTSERGACPTCGAGWERVGKIGWLPSCDCYGVSIPHIPEMPEDCEPPVNCQACDGDGIVDAGPLFGGAGFPCVDCQGTGITKPGNEPWVVWTAEADRINLERIELLAKINQDEPTRPCLVLDPFTGSGTTVKVAKRLGRSAIGSDLSFKYLDRNARKRVDLEQPALF